MGIQVELLIQNGKFAGVALLFILLAVIVATNVFLRLANLVLRAKVLTISQETQAAFRSRTRRWAAFICFLLMLPIVAGLLVATQQGVRLGDFLQSILAKVGTRDWIGLGVSTLKTLGVILAAFVVARIIVTTLHYLRERLQKSEVLVGHRERLDSLLEQLRLAMSTTILCGAAILCAKLVGIPEGGQRVLWSLSYLVVAVCVARFVVETAHLAIDVVFDLSEAISRLQSPLRYLGRLRHLSQLTKTSADYFIYVGIATYTLDSITPGTWVAQAGRVGLRIIAIFYISRVLIEVCVLFLKEFFLNRSGQDEAQNQQRQTLVPVAVGVLRYGIYFSAIVMVLREAGIDPTPILAGAGVVGVAVGLGAQAFVGDLVAGFFILFENLFLVGDFVVVGDVKGKVEEIGVRITKVRTEAGVLFSIPNGEVRKVASHSRGFVNVVIDFPVPYGEDLHKIFEILKKKTVEVRESQPAIIGLTEFGLEELRETAVLLRTVTMVKPAMDNEISAILRLAFWEALTSAGIQAPHARRMLLSPKPEVQGPPRTSEPIAARQSDIQRVKAYNLYRAFDVTGNRYLEASDLDALARRVVEHQRRPVGSPFHLELRSRLGIFWKEMVTSLDANADGRVSQEEFLQFCAHQEKALADPNHHSTQALADVLFLVADHDGNGTLSEREFVQCFRAYGIRDSVAAAGFKLIDSDDNGRINREEWLQFMRDIFLSKKINDASALVFGPDCRAD